MRTSIRTNNGREIVVISVGDKVRVHPDTRGTFLPVLRDEVCRVVLIDNRGNRRKPDVWVLCRAVDSRFNVEAQRYEHAERFISVADLEILL